MRITQSVGRRSTQKTSGRGQYLSHLSNHGHRGAPRWRQGSPIDGRARCPSRQDAILCSKYDYVQKSGCLEPRMGIKTVALTRRVRWNGICFMCYSTEPTSAAYSVRICAFPKTVVSDQPSKTRNHGSGPQNPGTKASKAC